MSLFDDIIRADAAAFDDPDAFPGVESVTLTFKNGTTRTVNAGVWRDEPVPIGNGYRPGILISFRNDATYGLAASEIDGGGVITVTVAEHVGGTAVAMPLKRCVDPDKVSDVGRVWVQVG